jgi:transcriptional regulator with XRE-family HTH domain
MDLKTWREKQGMTQEELAKKLRTFQPRVSALESGRITPSLRTAARIMEITGGQVTMADWLKKSTGA